VDDVDTVLSDPSSESIQVSEAWMSERCNDTEYMVDTIAAAPQESDMPVTQRDSVGECEFGIGGIFVGRVFDDRAPRRMSSCEAESIDGVHVTDHSRRNEAETKRMVEARVCADHFSCEGQFPQHSGVGRMTSDDHDGMFVGHVFMKSMLGCGCTHISLRWHYPDQVLGSASADALSAHCPVSSPFSTL
jgi:hypothetical protein